MWDPGQWCQAVGSPAEASRGNSPRHQIIFCEVCENSGDSLWARATDDQSWPQASSWNFLMLFNLWILHFSLPDEQFSLAGKSLGYIGYRHFKLPHCLLTPLVQVHRSFSTYCCYWHLFVLSMFPFFINLWFDSYPFVHLVAESEAIIINVLLFIWSTLQILHCDNSTTRITVPLRLTTRQPMLSSCFAS